jgi:hypothetical protein
MPVELPGFSPTRAVAFQDDGTCIVYVTPPPFMRLPRVSVHLDASQYDRYCAWRLGRGMIQELLPELSDDDREKLMSGIGPEDFARLAREDAE